MFASETIAKKDIVLFLSCADESGRPGFPGSVPVVNPTWFQIQDSCESYRVLSQNSLSNLTVC
jgi:hypothetical protein